MRISFVKSPFKWRHPMVNMLPPHEYNLINLILFGNHNHTFGQNLVGLGR